MITSTRATHRKRRSDGRTGARFRGEANDRSWDKMVEGLVRDVRYNGLCFVKSPRVIRAIKERHSENVRIEYNKDEDIYYVYKKR